MEKRIKIQDDIHSRIVKAYSNFKKAAKDRLAKRSYLTTRLEDLDTLWSQFQANHAKIVEESEVAALNTTAYALKDVYSICEELHLLYKSDIKDALDTVSSLTDKKNEDDNTDKCSSAVDLPRISLPMFSGKYHEWPSFRDLFTSLVDKNKKLDSVQKLHYLKCNLAGEAEQLVRHIAITSDNYALCWKQLSDRYNNKRYLVNSTLTRLMNQRSITTESASALRELIDNTRECMAALKTLGIDVSSWDMIVIYILSAKLDNETRKHWELKTGADTQNLPTFSEFITFLEVRSRGLDFIDESNSKGKSNMSIKSTKPSTISAARTHHVVAPSKLSCLYCSDDHRLYNCKQFAKDDSGTRRSFVQSNNLCFNCLNPGHSVYNCRQSSRCRICKKKHHSLLHPKNNTNLTDPGDQIPSAHSTNKVNQPTDPPVISCFSNSSNRVLLATALVKARASTGGFVTLRCLVDQGSQASFITESAVQLLGLKKSSHKSCILGIGSELNTAITSKGKVSLEIQSVHYKYSNCIQAFVLHTLTTVLPEKPVVIEIWPELRNLPLADPSFSTPNKIDVLLGADVFSDILLDGLVKGPPGLPIAQNTQLGWILSGRVTTSVTPTMVRCNHVHQVEEADLLTRFWELEAEPSSTNLRPPLSEEEEKCEKIFTSTTQRDSSGRYIVRLPFKDEDPKCKYGHSKQIATRQFYNLEKRLSTQPTLKVQYSEVMTEYIDLGHMEIIPKDQIDNPHAVYLPHHAVIRNDKDTTKLRVVFNASCKGINGASLNDDLLKGPALQDDLRHLLMRWRSYPICLVADIVKMYRQIKVADPDTDFQRLVWRENPDDELQHLRLSRVTFGTASAPYLAVRALQQIAHDDGDTFPQAAKRVLEEFYMDDLMSGCSSVSEGVEIYKEMNTLLQGGGFELQKWSSNNEELLNQLRVGEVKSDADLKLKTDDVIKILGLTWNRQSDEFFYVVKLQPLSPPITKRKMISEISRLFDPLGWLSPVIITAKIFIQKLWLTGIEWDDEVPFALLNEWLQYRSNLNQLASFRLPRWINTHTEDQVRELHGFCDASQEAYAAVVYLRVVDRHGTVHVALITAKTKVAPIKQISVPRLELCGAVLLTRLLVEVCNVMTIEKIKIHAWTDSSIVLAWLRGQPNRWKTFVANRVSEIITSLGPNQWSHVLTKENPADGASRGSNNPDEELWLQGPTWLKEKFINYKRGKVDDTQLEERVKTGCFHAYGNHDKLETASTDIISRFSSLRRLIRVVARCKRFANRCRKEKIENTAWCTSLDLEESLKTCIRLTQKTSFHDELEDLKKTKDVKKKSKLTSLNPMIDEAGILRVGGRLELAPISSTMKHPIILPRNSHFTQLVIADSHERTLHGGPQLMLNYLRSKYWIIGAKDLVKLFVRKCVTCVRYSARMRHQLMGQLPTARSTICRPFFKSGVDYAGPINIRTSHGRGHKSFKGYICLFICMSTRAIHLEAVSDLSANGFLAAFKRFVARRGHCSEVWSDNGTNFVGAARELKAMYASQKVGIASEIADYLAHNYGTKWHFIPPHSPNFGGLWEAGVKSTKHHLKRVIGCSTLTYEELSTLLYQIEACLNSRPLSLINDNPADPIPLTPGHFLIGEPLVVAPDYNYETTNITNLRRWQLMQRMTQEFWRRWSREYLTQFYHRYKWSHKIPEPAIGDIVLVSEDNLPPSKWLYGRIVDKHSGLDGVTRVVSLKCNDNVIKRPVNKLCFLPICT